STCGLFGWWSRAPVAAFGTTSCRRPSRLDPISVVNTLTPVTLPPGRFKLTTNPVFTGSSPVNTIGIVEVSALTARAGPVPPVATITLTWRWTRSAASFRQSIILALSRTVLNRDVLALRIASFLQALTECAHQVHGAFKRRAPEKPDHRHRRLLRARSERPRRCCAAEQRDELAPLDHSITSSAHSHSGRPPNMNTTPAQLETPRPTPP